MEDLDVTQSMPGYVGVSVTNQMVSEIRKAGKFSLLHSSDTSKLALSLQLPLCPSTPGEHKDF